VNKGTLQEARELVDRMINTPRTCEHCPRVSVEDIQTRVAELGTAAVLEEGWKPCPNNAAWFTQCSECAGKEMYPWAKRLDVERVHQFLLENPDDVFSVAELGYLVK